MEKHKISERKIIIYTAGLVVLAGLFRLVFYSFGVILFYLAFVPFMAYRMVMLYRQRKKQRTSLENYRTMVLIAMLVTIVFNIAGWQEADFFLLFLLMMDYLLVINKKF